MYKCNEVAVTEKQKRAVVGLRREFGSKHLNLDNLPAKQLPPAPLADSSRLDICSHFYHWLLCMDHLGASGSSASPYFMTVSDCMDFSSNCTLNERCVGFCGGDRCSVLILDGFSGLSEIKRLY